MKTAPLLSIGIIFKNEERCIERCLKSLQPLRDAIPCELIMADTGAEDGSRAIAERYADEVFDFEWIDDFSAARNAVMDRCHGKWYFSIDCDEWLDEDVTELVGFLTGEEKADLCFVVVRNYHSAELEKGEFYNDFSALRLARMSAGIRYRGTIHEYWYYDESAAQLNRTILHHDGYFFSDSKAAKKKYERNMILLRKILKDEPDNLRILHQCIESGGYDPDYLQYIRHSVEVVQNRRDHRWELYGGCILRHAAETAYRMELPELEEWIGLAETGFPDSVFTRVDVNHTAFLAAHDAEEWEKVVRYGEAYRKGIRAMRESPLKIKRELAVSCTHFDNPAIERTVMIGLANAYLHTKQGEAALRLIAQLEGEKLDPEQTHNTAVALCQLHAETFLDVSPTLTAFYDQISKKEPDEQKQQARLAAFDAIAAAAFTKEYREEEQEHEGYYRPAYTAFRCLAGKCEAGRAAGLMMAIDPGEICEWLARVENWQALPIEALEYALREGVAFPLPEKPLNVEILDGLAAKLTHGENMARQITLDLPEDAEYPGLQSLYWAQSLVLASLKTFDWKLKKWESLSGANAQAAQNKEQPTDTPETGLALIRRFAQIESALLPLLYTPEMLGEENAALLPSMHRWGVYCTRALNALDAGRPQEYLAILRRGVNACPGEKDTVQFLLNRFREDTHPKASPELLALAEKVRTIFAAYDPADPAVAALKASPAYQQVAWIIEEPNAGGLPS